MQSSQADTRNIFSHEARGRALLREDPHFMAQKAKIIADFKALDLQKIHDAIATFNSVKTYILGETSWLVLDAA